MKMLYKDAVPEVQPANGGSERRIWLCWYFNPTCIKHAATHPAVLIQNMQLHIH